MSIAWTTGEGTLYYPDLAKRDDFGKLSTIVFIGKEDVKKLDKIVSAEAGDFFKRGLPEGFKNPIKDGNEKMKKVKRLDDETGEIIEEKVQHPDYKGKTYCKVGTKDIVAVIDANGAEVKDLKKVKSGVKAKVSLEARAYDHMGNQGVALKLIGIQLVDDNAILGS
jgi:hypothetical protein